MLINPAMLLVLILTGSHFFMPVWKCDKVKKLRLHGTCDITHVVLRGRIEIGHLCCLTADSDCSQQESGLMSLPPLWGLTI